MQIPSGLQFNAYLQWRVFVITHICKILVSANTHDCDMHYFANYVLFNNYYFANMYYSVSFVHSKYLFPNLGRSENQTVYNT